MSQTALLFSFFLANNKMISLATFFILIEVCYDGATYGLKSWRYIAAKIWNALPNQFHAANNVGTF